MKLRGKISLLALGLFVGLVVWLFWPGNGAQRAAERTRALVRQQGFKTDLADFHAPVSAEARARLEVVNRAGAALVDALPYRSFDLMTPVATNAAVVLGQQPEIAVDTDSPAWKGLRNLLSEKRALLDEACFVAISNPTSSEQAAASLPLQESNFQQMGYQRAVAMALALRALIELHDQHSDASWTNLLALTSLATAPPMQPGNFSGIMRFAWVTIAERATWEALQSGAWDEIYLARLQREWQTPDFFAGLADSIAFTRANMVATCEAERRSPAPSRTPFGQIANDLALSPSRGWDELTAAYRHSRYQKHGSYTDESAILLYYCDREREVSRATNASSWLEMQALPGVTNAPPLATSRTYPVQAGFGSRGSGSGQGGFSRSRQSLPSRAVEAEARRRLVVTALALERYRLAHNIYPESLSRLVPQYVGKAPVDFMDGKPLRYHPTEDGHFVLYSAGLDCVDDGGRMHPDVSQNGGPGRGLFRLEGPDLLWPRPATKAEAEAGLKSLQVARSGMNSDNRRN